MSFVCTKCCHAQRLLCRSAAALRPICHASQSSRQPINIRSQRSCCQNTARKDPSSTASRNAGIEPIQATCICNMNRTALCPALLILMSFTADLPCRLPMFCSQLQLLFICCNAVCQHSPCPALTYELYCCCSQTVRPSDALDQPWSGLAGLACSKLSLFVGCNAVCQRSPCPVLTHELFCCYTQTVRPSDALEQPLSGLAGLARSELEGARVCIVLDGLQRLALIC